MPIDDIVGEKAARGEIDAELAAEASGQRGMAMHRMAQGQQSQLGQIGQRPPGAMPTLENVVSLEKTDIQMWADIGILIMLILIWARL